MRATQSREKLKQMLGAEIVPEKHVSVPASFIADFAAVCTRYGLTDEEVREAREAARRDLENALPCFAAMAREEA